MKNNKWRIRDLIDLEYFLHKQEGVEGKSDSENRNPEDREIFLKYIEPVLPQSGERNSNHRKWILRMWLEKRRSLEKEKNGHEDLLPGDAFHVAYQLLLPFFVIAGAFAGAAVAFSFLVYKGTSPINVSVYIGLFVILQVFLVIAIIVLLILKRRASDFSRLSFVNTLLGKFMARMVIRLKETAYSKLSGENRHRIEAVMGLARGKKKTYGSVFYWPFFILAQIFAVSFNIGILSATILKVVGSDLAFGWQSTLRLSSHAVYQTVVLLSSPWSWFLPEEIAHPSLAQIEGSRMILKDGIYHLSTSGLVSWWPFLCFSVLCYGFFPRLLLLAGGIIAQAKAISAIGFHNAACERLMFQMKTPVMNTKGSPEEELPNDIFRLDDLSSLSPSGEGQNPIPGNSIIALIPIDIMDSCSENELTKIVAECTGLRLIRTLLYGKNPEEDRIVLEFISETRLGMEHPNLIVIQEAWQPPIKEMMLFLKQLRGAVGDKALIRIGLIGKPDPNTVFTPVSVENTAIWKHAMNRLGDPSILVETLECKP